MCWRVAGLLPGGIVGYPLSLSSALNVICLFERRFAIYNLYSRVMLCVVVEVCRARIICVLVLISFLIGCDSGSHLDLMVKWLSSS